MASTEEEDSVYIELSKNPIRFEPVSKVTNVFFDDSNRQASIYQYPVVCTQVLYKAHVLYCALFSRSCFFFLWKLLKSAFLCFIF